jgi:hypothetical protein
MAHAANTRNVFAPLKYGFAEFCVIRGTVSGGSGAITRDADFSSPDTTITRNTTGLYDITFPPSQGAMWVQPGAVQLAAATGSSGQGVALNAGAGTGQIETSITPGTAADPADTSIVTVVLLLTGSVKA